MSFLDNNKEKAIELLGGVSQEKYDSLEKQYGGYRTDSLKHIKQIDQDKANLLIEITKLEAQKSSLSKRYEESLLDESKAKGAFLKWLGLSSSVLSRPASVQRPETDDIPKEAAKIVSGTSEYPDVIDDQWYKVSVYTRGSGMNGLKHEVLYAIDLEFSVNRKAHKMFFRAFYLPSGWDLKIDVTKNKKAANLHKLCLITGQKNRLHYLNTSQLRAAIFSKQPYCQKSFNTKAVSIPILVNLVKRAKNLRNLGTRKVSSIVGFQFS